MLNTKGNDIINWFVVLGDIIIANATLLIYKATQPYSMPESLIFGTKSAMVVITLSMIITSLIIPSVVHQRRTGYSVIIKRNLHMVVVHTMIFSVTCRLMTHTGNYVVFSCVYAISLWVLIMIARILERNVLRFIRTMGRNSHSVLFIGSDPANLAIYDQLMSDPATGYHVIGYFSNDIMEGAPSELKKLGSRDDLTEMMQKDEYGFRIPDEIYCSISHDEVQFLRNVMTFCDKHIIHFFYVPRIFGNIQLSLRPELIGNSVIFTNRHEPLNQLSNKIKKRTFDIVTSSLILICILPFIPIIALIIKIQSPGPLFFKQERTGLNGRNFMCYKFRSMHVNKDADKIQATKDDPRKFAFGNFMRKTNIDEFPQFFNVLKGDMSIVGPRPHMVFHTEKYSAIIDQYMVRHFSKPGITGYAQVTGFRGETEELWQMEGRIKKDIWYIENWTMWLDIKIIFMTAWTIIHPDKAAY